MQEQDYRSPQQAADVWGVTRATVSNWLNKGHIAGAVKIGRKWRIPAGTVERIARDGLELDDKETR